MRQAPAFATERIRRKSKDGNGSAAVEFFPFGIGADLPISDFRVLVQDLDAKSGHSFIPFIDRGAASSAFGPHTDEAERVDRDTFCPEGDAPKGRNIRHAQAAFVTPKTNCQVIYTGTAPEGNVGY